MSRFNDALVTAWGRVGTRFLPFADAAFDHGSERQRITLALRSFL